MGDYMNSHKAAWMQSVGIDYSNTRRPDIRAKFQSAHHRMFHGHSDKTKWERIGRPLFVDTPLDVAEWLVKVGII